MNILFVNHHGYSSNSAVHIICLATELVAMGEDVAVAVPEGKDTRPPRNVSFKSVTYESAPTMRFDDGRQADLIHAWTPRQNVACITRKLSAIHRCPYLVHLEDNEYVITAAFLGVGLAKFWRRIDTEQYFSVPDHLAEPKDMRSFLEGAIGVTAVIDRLLEFKPRHVPGMVIQPAAERSIFYPRAADDNLRAELGIRSTAKVIVYHGNVHPANISDVRSLYLAVGAVKRRGVDIVLLRLGTDYSAVLSIELKEIEQLIVAVPFQPRERLPNYLALADLFVQPGRPDEFNAYRFPSKLPEFFAMGRPVILPATNIGLAVVPDAEALLLHRGDALEIADAIMRVCSDAAIASTLAEGARRFFDRTFDWHKSASTLLDFYTRLDLSAKLSDLTDDRALQRLATKYVGLGAPPLISYATVRDFIDDLGHLPALSTINQDLKDAQRPWVFRAILACVPSGARLLEIGAGEPVVAGLLVRLGYEVTVIDPYDGTAKGPTDFADIRRRFPDVKFRRGLFPHALTENDEPFDCIYSISVMEHLPLELIGGVFDAIAQHCRPATSFTIHAIDHVLLGAGTADHLARLRAISRCLGLDEEDLDEVLGQIQEDPDAYFLSAEAHNRWRDNLPYLSFPMRRCVSIQICAPVRQDVRPASYAPDMRTQIDPVQELAMPEVQERLTQLATYFGVSSAMHNEDFLFRFMRDQTPGVESVERYFSSGSSDARRISNTIITLLPDVSNPKVLDFAAGFGRVSRHLTIIAPNLELETCDIHPNAVAFSRSQLHLRSFCSNYWPREDTLERESYNFIFALSFFSHIPNELFTDWLRLLYNSLKIGGILLFTTHGEASISLYPNLAELYDSRLGFGYYRSSDQHEINGGIYGTSVTDSRYVLRQITKAGAKLLGFQSAAWWGHQDEWTIRKVADPQGS